MIGSFFFVMSYFNFVSMHTHTHTHYGLGPGLIQQGLKLPKYH